MSTTEHAARLLTIRDAAARLKVSRATAYRMVYDGRLPTLQLGGPGAPLRVDEAELERWLRGEPENAGVFRSFRARSVLAERDAVPSGQSTAAPALAGEEHRA